MASGLQVESDEVVHFQTGEDSAEECSKVELRLLYEAGEVSDATRLWTEGMDAWYPLGAVKIWLGLDDAQAPPQPEPEDEPVATSESVGEYCMQVTTVSGRWHSLL